jgi:hypothetical protein
MNLLQTSRSVLLAMAALGIAGCGYHVAGAENGLPADIRSIRVGDIENRTREYGLEKSLAFALEREIVIRQQLAISQDPGGGDAVLNGRIRSVEVRPVAFNKGDQAMQYEITMLLDLRLTRRDNGEVLWNGAGLRQDTEYAASQAVVVTSSSQFQQQALDAANLRDPQMSPQIAAHPQSIGIMLGETERRTALQRLLQQAARDIYNSLLENF